MAEQQDRQRKNFSDEVWQEAKAAAERAAQLVRERPEARGITIDGPTSKDLDDAFWLERDAQGGYTLSVSIADVGALVTPAETPEMDREALQRAFTRYYSTGQAPMLPRKLSEDRLSLLEAQPRPAITLTLPLSADLQPGEPSICRTMLSSSKRLNYDEVDEEIDHPRTEYAPMLREAFRLAQGLFQARRDRGALAIYDLRAGWATTEEGVLIRLSAGERHKAHLIIQELMILANETFALYFAQRGIPVLYRNHTAKAIAPGRSALLKLLDTVLAQPGRAHTERVRATVNLALERAGYAPTVEGHFGLNLPVYVHMTSPLRRYPDLINQRILHALLRDEAPPYTKEDLERIAAHINAEEGRIKDAKRAHFLAQHEAPLRRTLAEAAQARTPEALQELDASNFHSVIRMAAQEHELLPEVEQEALRRLEEESLQPHDLFTLTFRFENSGPAWERMTRAILAWLRRRPYHAVTLLMMAQQVHGWPAPRYELGYAGTPNTRLFTARARIEIAGKRYLSAWQRAPKKELAKQRAIADLLERIAGLAPAEAEEAPETQDEPPAEAEASAAQETGPAQNYKGQLLELAQKQKWGRPRFTEGERSGPPHAPIFTVYGTLTIDGQLYSAQASGGSRTRAEQEVARQLLEQIPSPAAATGAVPPVFSTINPVGSLHQMTQKQEIRSASYSYEMSGPSHDPVFTCTCTVIKPDGSSLTRRALGKSKREATQAAALHALRALFSVEDEPGRDER